MSSLNAAAQNYLKKYGEKQALKIFSALSSQKESMAPLCSLLVIPVYDESASILTKLLDSGPLKNTLVVLVFNCPVGGEVSSKQNTSRCYVETGFHYQLQSYVVSIEDREEIEVQFGPFQNDSCLLCIDLTSADQWLPENKGVGLARKIGLDTGLALSGMFTRSLRWMHCSDADVVLPADYFDSRILSSEAAAIVYPFTHISQNGFEEAISLYDFSLRYYVDRLKWAGSNFAFHTIGSTMAVSVGAYVKARGMSKKSGGEDFYFLNKVAKLGPVISLDGTPIEIEGRPSHRVPFGTGPAVSEIASMVEPLVEYRYYHPNSFHLLKALLTAAGLFTANHLTTSTNNPSTNFARARIANTIAMDQHVELGAQQYYEQFQAVFAREIQRDEFLCESHRKDTESLVNAALDALADIGMRRAFTHLQRYVSKHTLFLYQFNLWFDAFKTLKFIHAIRERLYPEIPLETVLETSQNLDEHLIQSGQRILQRKTSIESGV